MNFEMLFATSNKHKLQEVREILSPHGIIVYGINDLNLSPRDVIEDGKDYFSNALIKAKALQELTNMPIISDDSGLEIVSLDNKPGLYSARFASQYGGHAKAIEEILKELKGKPNREAYFICSICLLNVENKPLKFEARVKGNIANSPDGTSGFGYDPIFIEEKLNKTYGLMTKEEKNQHSHRAKALKKLIVYLKINHLIN